MPLSTITAVTKATGHGTSITLNLNCLNEKYLLAWQTVLYSVTKYDNGLNTFSNTIGIFFI
jgi:hypothetical protein